MPFLQISSHDLGPAGAEHPSHEPPRVALSCRAPDDGPAARASLEVARDAAPAVGYVTEEPGGRLRVTGWLPRGQFRRLCNALAEGGPLRLVFDLRDPGARVGYLSMIGLAGPGGVLAMARSVPLPAPVRAERIPARRFAMPH